MSLPIPGTKISLLSKNKSLDCYSWSIPAGPGVCAGFNLEPGSVCQQCYAAQGRYRMSNTIRAQKARLRWWRKTKDEKIVRVMSKAIRSATIYNPYFRVFDSGDFSNMRDVSLWSQICEACPEVKFWFSTRAWRDEEVYYALIDLELDNVVVRFSYLEIDEEVDWEDVVLTSSVVTTGEGCPKQIYGSCTLGRCRACWDPQVRHITYKLHGYPVNWRKSA